MDSVVAGNADFLHEPRSEHARSLSCNVQNLKIATEIHAIEIQIGSTTLAEIGLNHDRSSFLIQRVLVNFCMFYLVAGVCGLSNE
jgi:hypothetical protein